MRPNLQTRLACLSLRLALVCLPLWLLLGGPHRAHAQEGSLGARGYHATNSYAFSDIENINTATGNLMLQIPITSLPEGRNGLSAGVSLIYNSKTWDTWVEHVEGADPYGNPRNYTLNQLFASPESGWRYGFEYSLQLSDRISFFALENKPRCPEQYEAEYIFRLRVRFPDGSLHEFRPAGYNDLSNDGYYRIRPDGWIATCDGVSPDGAGYARIIPYGSTGAMTYYSVDGTHVRLEVQRDGDDNWSNNPWALYFPDGRRVTGGNAPQRIHDRNGNYVQILNVTHNAHPATKIVDEFNRSVIIEYDDASNQDYIYAWGFNNAELKWTVKWKTIYPYKKYNPTNDGDLYTSAEYIVDGLRVVDQIITPTQDGSRSYTLAYNAPAARPDTGAYSVGWGELSSLTLPTGARADYQYELDGVNEIDWRTAQQNTPKRKEVVYQSEYDNTSSQVKEVWTYELNPYQPRRVITPDGGVFGEVIDIGYNGETWRDGLSVETKRPDGSKVERIWRPNTPYGLEPINPYVKTEFTSITDGAGNFVKTAIVDYTRDQNGNLLRQETYDWIDYALVERDAAGRPTKIPDDLVPVSVDVMGYHVSVPASTDTSTDSTLVYHKATAPRLRTATAWTEVRDGAEAVQARTEFFYDDATTTGNLTIQKSWDSTKGPLTTPLTAANSISYSNVYDGVHGNLTKSTDASGTQTEYFYEPVNGFPGLYVTEAVRAPGTPFQRASRKQYDFWSGLVTRSTDVSNDVATTYGYDAFGRLTLSALAAGRADESRTATTYEDAARRVVVRADLDAPGDGKMVTIQHFDQLGRLRLSRQLEGAATAAVIADEKVGIKVQTRYRVAQPYTYQLTSNPYRAETSALASGEPSMGWKRVTIDNSGRLSEVRHFSGTGLPAPWGANAVTTGAETYSYEANSTTIADADNNVRRSFADGLGRLTRVDEPDAVSNSLGTVANPTQKTVYTYSALSNLTKVEQGAQTRNFTFSSLSRLISMQHPESGVTTYEYNDAGQLKKRVDARNVKTTLEYDGIGRPKTKSYDVTQATPAGSVAETPTVTYTYDGEGVEGGIPFSIGQLTAVTSSVSASYVDEFDPRGRVKRRRQVTGGQTYPMSYTYDATSNLKTEVYPSGRVVTHNYDVAGRLSGLTGQAPNEPVKNYLSSFQYEPFGGLKAVRLGETLWETMAFNPRMQPTNIGLGTSATDSSLFKLTLTYGVSNNNGNVRTQALSAPGVSLTQTYTYDRLNRLKVAEETGAAGAVWKQTYTYDPYGNRRIDAAAGQTTPGLVGDNPTVNPANNRVNQAGYVYDFAGNVRQDIRNSLTNHYKYDAENRLVEFNGGQARYAYDGEGRRVQRIEGAAAPLTTVAVYNMDGQMIAEYSNTLPQSGGTKFLTPDHLGTPRVITSRNGTVLARHDYLPFGQEIFGLGNRSTDNGYFEDNLRQKFTGKQRDRESQLDYFLARYYDSGSGRFISPDYFDGNPHDLFAEPGRSRAMPYATLGNPQTLNSYAYVTNNPTTLVDSDGHQGGEWEKIPGASSRYEMRIDNSNQNDAVNVHVRERGKTDLGKIKVFNNNLPDDSEGKKIPKNVQQKILDALRRKGIEGRTPTFSGQPSAVEAKAAAEAAQAAEANPAPQERRPVTRRHHTPSRRRGGGGKGTSNVFLGLTILQLILDAIGQAEDDALGYYFNAEGKVVVTDMAKFVQNWDPDLILTFQGIEFKLINGKLMSISPLCRGCELRQDPNGEIYIDEMAQLPRRSYEQGDDPRTLRSPVPDR